VFRQIKHKLKSDKSEIGLPVIACLCAYVLRVTFDVSFDFETRMLFFYSAIVVSAWWSGFKGGMLATFLTVVFDVFLLNDLQIFGDGDLRDFARLGLVSVNGVFISALFWIVKDAVREERLAKERAERSEEKYRALLAESQRIAESLRVSERKYRLVFSASPLPKWIIDRRTLKIVEVNDAAVRHYGYTRDEFLNLSIVDLCFRDDAESLRGHLNEVHSADSRAASSSELSIRHRRRSGEIINAVTYISDLDFDGRPVALIAANDVTSILEAEARLREAKEAADKAKQAAEAANEAKSRFLANMSHEIRTPLGAILGFAELMQDQELTPSDRLNCVSTILRNGEVLSRVINDILDLSKIESDRLEIERIPFNPLELLDEVTALLSLQAQEKGLELSVKSQGPLPMLVLTDPTRLRQILLNIIGNAIKFTARGKVEVRVRSFPKPGTSDRSALEFVVHDTGPGITKEQRKRLFQPFLQADTSTARVYGGTGLGLVLSQRLARALGGDLHLKWSEPGKGSIFAFTVDIGSRDELSEIGMRTEVNILASGADHRVVHGATAWTDPIDIHVLLVEDAPDNRVLVSRFIKAAGARVDCVDNGLEGVMSALSGKYDLVLMDIQMPRMDGFEAVRLLRREGYQGPIVALTAHAMKSDREQCLEAGFDDHLVKPINRKALIETLRRYAPGANPRSKDLSPQPQIH